MNATKDQEPKKNSKDRRFLYCAAKSKGFVSEQLYSHRYNESSIYALVVSCCQKSAFTDYFNHIRCMFYGHPGPGVDRVFHWRDFRPWRDVNEEEKSDFVDSWFKTIERMREDAIFDDDSYIWPIDDERSGSVVAWSPSVPQIWNY